LKKLLCLAVGFVSAVEYADIDKAFASASVHTVRLAEIGAQIEQQGPIDQIGTLCYQQMREIQAEIEDLDATHIKFTERCDTMKSRYKSHITSLSLRIARYDKRGSSWATRWNKQRPLIPPRKNRRERYLRELNKKEAQVLKAKARRAATKATYDQDMIDFAQALKDIDGIKKILTQSPSLSGSQTSGNVAKQGFLESVDTICKSDRMKKMSHRFTLAAQFLDQEEEEDAPSATDKIMNLLIKMRDEMWAEMDKLTKNENQSISLHKRWLLSARRYIYGKHYRRAIEYMRIGSTLTTIGRYMIQEAKNRQSSAKTVKRVDATQIKKDFLEDECSAEPPLYQKSRATKIAEIATIEKMLKVIRGLNWSGAVYNSISRISAAGVDENPEAGFNLGWQMDVHLGMQAKGAHVYAIANKDIKDFGRVAIKLEVGNSWVWASFDAFSSDPTRYLVPTNSDGKVNQRYVKNLVIKKSSAAKVTDGSQAQGNLEMWAGQSLPKNEKKIPGAEDGLMDFGDERKFDRQLYGCFQVHDYLGKQTLLAVNDLFKANKGVGIGNSGAKKDNDWTYAANSKGYKERKEKVTITWFYQAKGYGKAPAPAPVKKAPAPAPVKKL